MGSERVPLGGESLARGRARGRFGVVLGSAESRGVGARMQSRTRATIVAVIVTGAVVGVLVGTDVLHERDVDKSTPSGAALAAGVVDREATSPDPVIAEIQHQIVAAKAQGRLDTSALNWKNGGVPLRVPQKPLAPFDEKRTYGWVVRTDHGTLRVRLWPAKAPKHVANAIFLSLLGYYDGTVLWRVVPGEALEGGCPLGDGKGSPGFSIESEFGDGDENAHARRGLLASTGVGGTTDDSKFRILFAPMRTLDMQSTVYGEVVDGQDVLDRLEKLGTEDGKPKQPIVVQRVDVEIR